jgi:pyoverdine/dityrosine biosynthesis protein Dit1/AcrR family transcriptional regulator
MMQPDFISRALLNSALELFRERGYSDVDLSDVATAADCSLDQLYLRFPRKEAFIMRLFDRTSNHLQTRVSDAPPGTVAERFQFLMRELLALLEPDRPLFRHLLPAMIDPDNRLGVLGPATDRIRVEVRGVFTLLVLGASDAPTSEQVEPLVELLYFAHLGLVFLFLQDQRDDPEFMANNIALASDLITIARKTILGSGQSWLSGKLAELAGFPNSNTLARRVERLVQDYIHPPHDSAHFSQAENVLRRLFRFRRLQSGAAECRSETCPQCLALHLPRVRQAMTEGLPIPLVLPAFPAKSANLSKVTGPLPDLSEELALRFLQERCDEMAELYEPGAELVICSDGRVFSDLVGVRDDDVTNYRHALIETIERLDLKSLQVFDLDDVRPNSDYDAMRRWLMEQFGESLEELETRTHEHDHHRQIFNGIHRFLMEDLADREPDLSRNQARKQSKVLAYEVIRRSNAWSRLVAELFGNALRLSIHPQPPHCDKIGILLGDADDLWLTPWHGVALLQADRFVLTRRARAEELGAQLISRNGRPSHFEIPKPVDRAEHTP